MRFVSIASGSSGNCIYVGTDQTHILVDVGISAKRIEQGLFEVGLKPSELSAVCITHEHSDHIRGLGVLARKYQIPIYGTAGTLKEIKKIKSPSAKARIRASVISSTDTALIFSRKEDLNIS